jgi:ParB-like chromosome segregation protein Spo0J
MQIRKLNELKEWERNPRTISEKALKGLGYSLDEFGDLSGIVFNARLKALVCGHQRLKALQQKYNGELRIENNIIITPKGEQFPIRIVDWDEKKHTAANIAANNQHIAGDFTEGLAPILDELKVDFPELSLDLRFDALRLDIEKEILARSGTEYDESIADRIELCVCPNCGNEHARKNR